MRLPLCCLRSSALRIGCLAHGGLWTRNPQTSPRCAPHEAEMAREGEGAAEAPMTVHFAAQNPPPHSGLGGCSTEISLVWRSPFGNRCEGASHPRIPRILPDVGLPKRGIESARRLTASKSAHPRQRRQYICRQRATRRRERRPDASDSTRALAESQHQAATLSVRSLEHAGFIASS
ncbi:hypothetical protein BCR34DRAFT_170283 [Clohesyomyces aquaticus]|uniref:Uncharacterized protein n=1 Tax=Clohesyomyces aquaticus TaxID=1231657 RepID=A0A1Y1ZZT4_9PLEO|nr:hypothetical protein BCR34DRAFT_170283 [Clohesyomyces aquaticus]